MKWVAGIFTLIIILIIIAADLGLGPFIFTFLNSIPGGDKTGHFVLMGILSFVVNLSLNVSKVRIFSIDVLKGSLIIAVAVTVEEFSQLFLEFRGFSLVDLFFDYAGIVIFGWLAERLVRMKSHS